MIKKLLAFTILILFIGLSIIPSSDTIILGESPPPILPSKPFEVNRKPAFTQILDSVDSSEEKSGGRKIAYIYCISSLEIYCKPWWFYLDGPEFDFEHLHNSPCGFAPSGGTYTCNGKWLVCEYSNGALYEIDLETGNITEIGGGGIRLNGLSYDPVNEKLYGVSSTDLYEIDIETGNQTYIGSFGSGPDIMIAIAFDADGVLYGWDIGNDNLWTINIETGQATLVGPLNLDLNYGQDGDFDFEDDILYLVANTVSPNFGQYLYKCNEDTGECTLVGEFPGIGEFTAFVIPYGGQLPTKPEIKGPCCGRRGLPNIFTVENECNASYYKWDWGDGNYSWNRSNSASYTWNEVGTYNISVKARNVYGESDWSDPLTIIIKKSKNRAINTPFLSFLHNFIQSHPNLFSILQKFIDILREYK